MRNNKKGRISSPAPATRKVNAMIKEEELDSFLYLNHEVAFDVSFPYAFCSCRVNGFDNLLKNQDDFIEKLKMVLVETSKLSGRTLRELMIGNGFPHCHVIDEKLQDTVRAAIRKIIESEHPQDIEKFYTQNIEDETFYQVGMSGSIRIIGCKTGNVFKILLIDYFHDLYPDERYNVRNKTIYKYSI